MRSAAVVLVLALAGCARPVAVPIPAAPIPAAASAAEVAALAAILAEEDRRVAEPADVIRHADSELPRVRARAAVAIGRLRFVGGIPTLERLIEDPDTAVAASAAFALGQVGDTSAVSALASLLTPEIAPERVTVAEEAAYALGKLRSARSRAALREFLAAAPVSSGAPALVARSALLAIWRFPRDETADPIARWLESADPEARWRATYALVRRPDPRATPVLRRLLDDRDERVRAWAVRGLTGPLSDSSSVGALAARQDLGEALGDPSYMVRINAIAALGTHQHPVAVGQLIRMMRSEQPHEALAATEAIGRLGDVAAGAIPVLEARVADRSLSPALARTALDALARISPGSARRAARAAALSQHWRLRAGAAAALSGSDAPELDTLLRDEDGRVAAAALQARVQGAADSLHVLRPVLVEALRSGDEGVRTTALRALRRLADPSTMPALLDAYGAAVREPAGDVAPAALEAIAELRTETRDPARAFFARFDRPDDPLLHRLAVERFGQAATDAWGEPTPLETGRTAADYERIVRTWMVPTLEGVPAPTMTIVTGSGEIVLRLFAADAPLTVQSFSDLAARGYFDGQEWPRVVPNFVVQGGDPRGDTSGGPGYSLRDEISRHRYVTGTLGMALSGPDTGGSQFFITHSPQPHLDGIYAVFGELVAGSEIAEMILPGDAIRSVRIDP